MSYCRGALSVCLSVVRKLFTFSTSPEMLWYILMKLGRDEVLMVLYKYCCFLARSAMGWIQGRAKIGHGGSPSFVQFRSQIFDVFWHLFVLVILAYFNAISLPLCSKVLNLHLFSVICIQIKKLLDCWWYSGARYTFAPLVSRWKGDI